MTSWREETQRRRRPSWWPGAARPGSGRLAFCIAAALALVLLGSAVPCAQAWGSPAPPPAPSESECRPYIEKALKEIEGTEVNCDDGSCSEAASEEAQVSTEDDGDAAGAGAESTETEAEDGGDASADASKEAQLDSNEDPSDKGESKEAASAEEAGEEAAEAAEAAEDVAEEAAEDTTEEATEEATEEDADATTEEQDVSAAEEAQLAQAEDSKEASQENASQETTEQGESAEAGDSATPQDEGTESTEATEESVEAKEASAEETKEESAEDTAAESKESVEEAVAESVEDTKEESAPGESAESAEEAKGESAEEAKGESTEETAADSKEEAAEPTAEESKEEAAAESKEESADAAAESTEDAAAESKEESADAAAESKEDSAESTAAESKEDAKEESAETPAEAGDSKESKEEATPESTEDSQGEAQAAEGEQGEQSSQEDKDSGDSADSVETPEEDLILEIEVPENLRPRDQIAQILKLDAESAETEMLLQRTVDVTLRELKRLYDTAIKPLEILYKYRDLSNRHFGDPEIFSKPLVLFMGPWSGGKSSIINYLLGTEFTAQALRTGAEPSPAYFNILMHGERYEVLDGTQLAADWTFSGLQKFGQGLLDRLRGVRLNSPLLEKINIVEIPGILEIRKQVERVFPFNDACQWFIDRADIIFLVYDPSKLDVGPETEAILDQLKGREYQTRIVLNKADQVKPEELMRVQGTLIWNISPLMSSAEPPVMYSTSLWSMPYETGAPIRLLAAQEKAFLRDLRQAFDRRVENKIASARRFAVRVRNHAKMVDCYLTTYYNHKSFFGNKKRVSDDIIDHPQDYHIYEGLSTLTNISRYDLPDPDTYRDFFRLNPLFEFQQLSATCTYFRGCPINRLDVAIAYDLPELVGKYKMNVEDTLIAVSKDSAPPKS